MRSLTYLCALFALLVGSLAHAGGYKAWPVSTGTVSNAHLVRTMPGQLVVQGEQNQKLYYAFGRDGGRSWNEATLDPPFDARGNAFPRSVGATPYFQLLGGWILDADTRPTDMPVWYYRFPLWRPTTLAATPADTFRRREVNSMAWGDTEGRCCYAFGAEDYPGYHARIWKSTDYGLSWAPLPNLNLDGHRTATVRTVTSGRVVWGNTDSQLVCIPPDGPPRLMWYPEAHRKLLALCAPNETLVTIVILDLLRPDPQTYVYASRDGGANWRGTKSFAEGATAADFIVPDVGVVAFQDTAPVFAARLLCTRDGWKTSVTDRIENGEVRDIKVVSDKEIYLLVQNRASGKLYYARWEPDW